MRRFIICDPGLFSLSGHHFNLDVRLQLGAAAEGYQVITLGNRSCNSSEVINALHPRATFRSGPYLDRSGLPITEELWTESNVLFASDLSRAHAELRFSGDDVLFLHTIRSSQVLGLARVLAALFEKAVPPRIVLYLLCPDIGDTAASVQVRFFKSALVQLAALTKLRILLMAETEQFVDKLDELSGSAVKISRGPLLLESQYRNRKNHSLPSESDVVGYFGYSSPRKGLTLLPKIVAAVLAANDLATFFVQAVAPRMPSEDYCAIVNSLRRHSRCELLEGLASYEEFQNYMERCSLVLLPYSPEYRGEGSGLLVEAMAQGSIVIAPDYCGFQEIIGDYEGVVMFSKWNADSISCAVIDALLRKNILKASAQKGRERLLVERSIERFFRDVCRYK